jgi:AraC-like DNA-binding protein
LEILRISRAVECLRFTQPPPKIGDLALICGFYDESHFIESFKSFTGLTPKQFLKNNTPVTDSVTWRDEVLHERTLVY